MSDIFYLSPCCGNENYYTVEWHEPVIYECLKCKRRFGREEVYVQVVEYGLEEEIERTAYMMEG